MSHLQLYMSIFQNLISLLLICAVFVNAMVHFDTDKMPDNSELIKLRVSNVMVSGQNGQDLEESNQDSFELDPMPVQMEVDLVCQGQPIHLNLRFHGNTVLNSQGSTAFNSTMEEIPVFTKSHDFQEISLDSFPRLYTESCRTFRDTNSQAAFLVIRDPLFSSFKFFGSFLMGNTQYFVQPYTVIGNNDTYRLHVSTETPPIDFSEDGLAQLPTVEGNSGIRKNVNQRSSFYSDVKKNNLSLSQKEEIVKEIMAEFSMLPSHKQDYDEDMKSPQNAGSPKESSDQRVITEDDNRTSPTPEPRKIPQNHESSSSQPQQNVSDVTKNPIFKKLLKRLGGKVSLREGRESSLERQQHREKRQAISTYTVEVIIVCDFLCYKGFQSIYGLSGETETKNVIALFFSYIREEYQISYSSVLDLYPELQTSIEITVPALYIATTSDDKIIGDYILENGTTNVDVGPSAFEFAIWVQDSLTVSLKADHYALVTGFDLYGSRFNSGVLGSVTGIPTVCDIDRISVNEFIPNLIGPILAHELGHSLGAQHDSLTQGVCSDTDRFIMAAVVGGLIPLSSDGNYYRFSPCSALFFRFTLPTKSCLRRIDFDSSTLPDKVPVLGQQFSLETQCSFTENATIWREFIVSLEGTWDRVCSSLICLIGRSGFGGLSFQFSTCGNRRWCEDGRCVGNPNAPERVVDCPAGDSPRVVCDVSKCNTYDDFFRFVMCCEACKPIRTERFVIFE